MPAVNTRTEPIRTRLDRESMQKFRKVVQRSGKTTTEFAREAILFYLDYLENEGDRERDSSYKDDLRRSTNRICSLLAKVALDTATLAHFIHATMDDVGKDQFKEAYQNAVKRVKSRISRTEREIVELLVDESQD